MTDAEYLRQAHEQALDNLQARCPHTESEWMEHHYAPGHFGGMVKCCKNCEKIIEHESTKFFIDDEEIKE